MEPSSQRLRCRLKRIEKRKKIVEKHPLEFLPNVQKMRRVFLFCPYSVKFAENSCVKLDKLTTMKKY